MEEFACARRKCQVYYGMPVCVLHAMRELDAHPHRPRGSHSLRAMHLGHRRPSGFDSWPAELPTTTSRNIVDVIIYHSVSCPSRTLLASARTSCYERPCGIARSRPHDQHTTEWIVLFVAGMIASLSARNEGQTVRGSAQFRLKRRGCFPRAAWNPQTRPLNGDSSPAGRNEE